MSKIYLHENPKDFYSFYLDIAKDLIMQIVRASHGKSLNEVLLQLQEQLIPDKKVYAEQLKDGYYHLTFADILSIIDNGDKFLDNKTLNYLYRSIIDYPITTQTRSNGQWIIIKTANSL